MSENTDKLNHGLDYADPDKHRQPDSRSALSVRTGSAVEAWMMDCAAELMQLKVPPYLARHPLTQYDVACIIRKWTPTIETAPNNSDEPIPATKQPTQAD